jgi:predicted DCC family thiol-disulfide oxidoreductase YuxK
MEQLTVLYNDQCPVCSFEIEHYRALCIKRGIDLGFEKISDKGPVLNSSGLSVTDAKRRLHVRTSDGYVKVGVDAFLALWAHMPIYKYLGRLVAIPGIYHLAVVVYNHVLAPLLFWWDKRRLHCDDSACS